MLYCAKFYIRGFGRVYEPKTPVMKLCTVQHYPIISSNSNNKEKTLSSSMYVCVYVDKQTEALLTHFYD